MFINTLSIEATIFTEANAEFEFGQHKLLTRFLHIKIAVFNNLLHARRYACQKLVAVQK